LLAATEDRPRVVVGNKSDLEAVGRGLSASSGGPDKAGPTNIRVSAKTGAGIDDLRRTIVQALTGDESLRDTAAISNTRHIALLQQAGASLHAAHAAARAGDTPEEFVLTDLQAARARLDEIVGVRTSEDVLRHIFEKFCIGK
jgi:tRNA modification GTPase